MNDQYCEIANVFKQLFDGSFSNLQAKTAFMELLPRGCRSFSGKFIALDLVYADIIDYLECRHPSQENPLHLFEISFEEVTKCQVCNFTETTIKNWMSFTILTRHLKVTTVDTLNACFNDYQGIRGTCDQCQSPCDRSRHLSTGPVILLIDYSEINLRNAPRVFDKSLTLNGEEYFLRGGVYGNGTHFISRFIDDNGYVFDYDGMYKEDYKHGNPSNAVLVRREELADLHGRITTVNRKNYLIGQLYYMKSTITENVFDSK